jgi:hypothetical protein
MKMAAVAQACGLAVLGKAVDMESVRREGKALAEANRP